MKENREIIEVAQTHNKLNPEDKKKAIETVNARIKARKIEISSKQKEMDEVQEKLGGKNV